MELAYTLYHEKTHAHQAPEGGALAEDVLGGEAGKIARIVIDPIGSIIDEIGDLF